MKKTELILPSLPNKAIVCFDPGESTGIIMVDHGKIVDTRTLRYDELMHQLVSPSHPWSAYKGKTEWICEDFRIYPWKSEHLGFDKCVPARLIGMIELTAHRLGIPLRLEWASEAKQFATDDKLRFYNWLPHLGTKHERDAARHAIYYLLTK